MSDYASFVQGGSTYPLTTSTTNSLLLDADPSLYYVLDYFQSVLNTYLAPRFAAELARAPALTLITQLVQAVAPYDVSPYLTQMQQSFPLLSVYRNTSKFVWRAQSWMRDDSTWTVEYILPPLSPAQVERLRPILRSIEAVLLDRIENTFDPAYRSGVSPWALAGLEEIVLQEAQHGFYAGDGNLVFPSWKATLLVKERQMPPVAGAFGTFSGTDTEIDLASTVDAQVSDFADVKLDFFSPTSVPNLVALYTADRTTLALNGYNVASLIDQSISAAPASSLAPNQPTLLPRAFLIGPKQLPKSAVRFDGLTSYLQATVAALAVDTGVTLICFSRLDNTTNRQLLFARTATSDTGAHTMGPEANTLGTAGNRWGVYVGGSSYDSPAGTDQQWHVHVVRATSTTNGASIASSLTYRLDGAPQTLTLKSGTGTWQGMATSTNLSVGGNPATLTTTAATGDSVIAMAFARALTDAECGQLERYCRSWAGLPNP
jgi:hypothetical protein